MDSLRVVFIVERASKTAQAFTTRRLARLAWRVAAQHGRWAAAESDLAIGAVASHPDARGSMEDAIGAGRRCTAGLHVFVRNLCLFKVAGSTHRAVEAMRNG